VPVALPEAVSAGASVAQALAVVVAGGFAYFKFIRGRTFRPRTTIELAGHLVAVGDGLAAHVSVSIQNAGASRLVLSGDHVQLLEVHGADAYVWNDAVASNDGVVLWSEGSERLVDLLSFEGRKVGGWPLEPGEHFFRELLVPLRFAEHAYRIRVTFRSDPDRRGRLSTWQRELIVMADAGPAQPRVDTGHLALPMLAVDAPRQGSGSPEAGSEAD
jgi:hypothetical protein